MLHFTKNNPKFWFYLKKCWCKICIHLFQMDRIKKKCPQFYRKSVKRSWLSFPAQRESCKGLGWLSDLCTLSASSFQLSCLQSQMFCPQKRTGHLLHPGQTFLPTGTQQHSPSFPLPLLHCPLLLSQRSCSVNCSVDSFHLLPKKIYSLIAFQWSSISLIWRCSYLWWGEKKNIIEVCYLMILNPI